MNPETTNILLFGKHLARNRWIMKQSKLIVMAGMQCSNRFSFLLCKIQTHDQCVKDYACRLVQFPKEMGCESSKSGEYIGRQPDVILNEILVAANFVTLLILVLE
jgi:hypothetical protein